MGKLVVRRRAHVACVNHDDRIYEGLKLGWPMLVALNTKWLLQKRSMSGIGNNTLR
jgi:hypothetical protein